MVLSATRLPLEELSQTLFDLVIRFCLTNPRGRRRSGSLKELEVLTLAILQQHQAPLIVGEIQRLLGILPAQMSRVIRALEARERPLISCSINPQDKRKIDVLLTPAGTKALQEYQSLRLHNISTLLSRFGEDDLENLHRLLEKVSDLIDSADRS